MNSKREKNKNHFNRYQEKRAISFSINTFEKIDEKENKKKHIQLGFACPSIERIAVCRHFEYVG